MTILFGAGVKVFEAVANAREGVVTVELRVKDGRAHVAVPGCPELVIVGEGQGLALDFEAVCAGGADVPIRYSARRSQPGD